MTLVWAEQFEDAVSAIAVERQIKGWSRAKKMALIAGDWAEIQRLAQSKTPKPSGNPLRAPLDEL